MNSAFLITIAIVWYYFAYKWYGGTLEKKIISPNDEIETPAISKNDGVDFYPANKMVLFGHHFSSIAGAGPILGPVAAVAAFGWGSAMIWILIGTVFIGAVHDYLSLMVSVRHDGNSVPEVAQKVIGTRARNLFSIFVLITLILVVAVFGFVAANTLKSTPQVVIPTFGIIPVAMLFGYMVYKKNLPLPIGTIIALLCLFTLIYLGFKFPISVPFEGKGSFTFWFILLMGYGLLASVLPVWMLLQPRDYISNWILIIGLGIGFIGTLVTHPNINAPFFTGFSSKSGPIWPMLFIIVACGAISGFHSLVGSGTTSKQLAKESQGKLVGYGAMLLEGVLATLAVITVSAGLFWIAPSGMEQFSFFNILGSDGPIKAFGMGYGRITQPLLGTFGMLFGITMLKTFVMTTLDTTIRLGRFVAAELIGPKMPVLKNRFIGSLFITIPAFYLGYTGTYNIIWPMFGASNQLVAALALLVVTAYLVGVKKTTKYTLYPAIFMIITTFAALIYQGYNHLFGPNPNYILGITSAILIVLAIIVAGEAKKILMLSKKQ
ncbi:carbon starvation CstA family protein [Tepidibacter formicigenes]|jgi:carbon starvation protein|uniref:Carbon starvation protein n=1 Tax=Tepidibacter formicigenes DSM 15518 TaxID=1123349 RepID=A0A1M6RDW4_9FIRM|nr:carbon starvation protein A [Tepidibacter formicigenes]SHK30606.1 carbon starvation protein [Tepidibacter formicigenes DSM 15518]